MVAKEWRKNRAPVETKCVIFDCDSKVRAKLLCEKHYQRLRKNGSTAKPKEKMPFLKNTQRCNECGRLKRLTDFYTNQRRVDGKRTKCKECNLVQARDNMLSKKYRLTQESYDERLKLQNYKCAICDLHYLRNIKNNKVIALAVDHDHETGKVRGLLCNNCNRGIGLLGDTVSSMERALQYLEAVK